MAQDILLGNDDGLKRILMNYFGTGSRKIT